MYIGSPIQDDDGHSTEADAAAAADETEANHEDDEAAADSDDSMASDASSGPSHQAYFRDEMKEEKLGDSTYLDKKAKKSMEKQKLRLKKKEEVTFKAKETTTTPSRSGSKVRKSIWPGKTK